MFMKKKNGNPKEVRQTWLLDMGGCFTEGLLFLLLAFNDIQVGSCYPAPARVCVIGLGPKPTFYHAGLKNFDLLPPWKRAFL